MRWLLTLLVAMAFAVLPLGDARAESAPPPPCHEAPASSGAAQPDPGETGKACAEHCLTQVNAELRVGALTGPSVRNLIASQPATSPALDRLRGAAAPEPRPPRV
ncbi:MAG: hypothetical protein NW200_15310 [Hyphomonadaceae bacterium]|nr:hypothetical protein [Hyphomonadaceae bacterium]